MNRISYAFFVFCIFTFTALSSQSAFACSPQGKALTLKAKISAADAIFTGTITGISQKMGIVTMKVTRVYKGSVYSSPSVQIPLSSASCGFDRLRKGTTLTVYGNDTADNVVDPLAYYVTGTSFSTSSFAGTHLGGLTAAEKRRFGKGFAPRTNFK